MSDRLNRFNPFTLCRFCHDIPQSCQILKMNKLSSVPLGHPPQTLFIRLWGQKKTLTGGYDLARS